MIVDVAKIDRQVEFLRKEVSQLKMKPDNWAQRKADMLESISKTLQDLRRHHQMTGLGGKPLEG